MLNGCACKDCGDFSMVFMVKDRLWARIADHRDDVLCPFCTNARAQKRLGRRLRPEDLTVARCNDAARMVAGLRVRARGPWQKQLDRRRQRGAHVE